MNATLAAGVQACAIHNVKEVLHCTIGGIRSLFPLFHYIEYLSPPLTAAMKGRSSASLLPLSLTTLTVLIKDNASNQRELLARDGMACLGYLLRQAPSHHLNEHVLTSLEELIQYSSWLNQPHYQPALTEEKPSTSASSSNTTNNANNNDWMIGINEGTFIPANMTNPALSLALATERTLFNDVFLNILFNLSIWMREGVSFAVQAEMVRMVKVQVSKQAKYFRRLIHPRILLDQIRQYLSYEDAIDAITFTGGTSESNGHGNFGTKLSLDVDNEGADSHESAVAVKLRQVRTLRGEWFDVIKDLMRFDVSREGDRE